jgi:hypothetical protein
MGFLDGSAAVRDNLHALLILDLLAYLFHIVSLVCSEADLLQLRRGDVG